MKQTTIPKRSEVAIGDQWKLASLFSDDEAWNTALVQFSGMAERVNAFKSQVATTSETLTPDVLASCLDTYRDAQLLGEKLGNYAFLKKSADESDAANLDRVGRYMMAASAFEAAVSWFIPSIQAIPEEKIHEWIGIGTVTPGTIV